VIKKVKKGTGWMGSLKEGVLLKVVQVSFQTSKFKGVRELREFTSFSKEHTAGGSDRLAVVLTRKKQEKPHERRNRKE